MQQDVSEFYSFRIEVVMMTRREVSDACGVSLRQVRRWDAGVSHPSRAVWRLLRLLAGDLGEITPEWRHWRISRTTGELFSLEWKESHFLPGALNALPFRLAQMAELRRQLRLGDQSAPPVYDKVVSINRETCR